MGLGWRKEYGISKLVVWRATVDSLGGTGWQTSHGWVDSAVCDQQLNKAVLRTKKRGLVGQLMISQNPHKTERREPPPPRPSPPAQHTVVQALCASGKHAIQFFFNWRKARVIAVRICGTNWLCLFVFLFFFRFFFFFGSCLDAGGPLCVYSIFYFVCFFGQVLTMYPMPSTSHLPRLPGIGISGVYHYV